MRSFFITVSFLFFAGCIHSQQLSQVTFSDAAHLSYFSIHTNQDVLIRITDKGQILEWGTEMQSLYSKNYYAPKLQPYLGRVEYYPPQSDSAFQGKLKSVGTCVLTYYASYEMSAKVGKLKSIGPLMLDYYSIYDFANLNGRLKTIGGRTLNYYSLTEDEGSKDKLKSIGSTLINYYGSFEDKLIKGKVKSIGLVTYAWYSSFDLSKSGLKSGTYRRNIDGVTYILQ
jgi:hypothetical protein